MPVRKKSLLQRKTNINRDFSITVKSDQEVSNKYSIIYNRTFDD